MRALPNRGVAWLCGLAVAALCSSASAQPNVPGPPSGEQAAVVPPRLKVDSPATYPEQALREGVAGGATVALILEIDAAGVVKNAVAPAPVGHGFDEAATAAAGKLVFEPATRNGTPVAAKIRFEYHFEPPLARLVGRVAKQPSDVPIAGAKVVVRDSSGRELETTTTDDGFFRVDGLPAGAVHVHVEATGRVSSDVDESLLPGQEASLVFRLNAPAAEPPPPVTAPGEPIEEVRVHGERPPREVTKRTIPREEIALIPGTNGDALRSLSNLPGVARPPPFGGQLVVRGSAPQDTNYFVDGTSIPIVYHFGGLSSVVPTEVLDRIDFYPGNYGAQFGRGMGGVVDVGLRGPKTDGKLHGMAQADLIDVRLLAERSLGKGWSFLVGGRRSWFDVWLGPILEASAGVSTAPRYYDYQVMLKKEFGPDHEARVLLFGSDDRLEIFGAGGGEVLGGGLRAVTAFWRIQTRYTNKISSSTRVNAVAATGGDTVSLGFGENYVDVSTFPFSGRAEISQRIARPLTANVGLDMLYTAYDLKARFPMPSRPGVPGGGPGETPLYSNSSDAVYTPGAYSELEVTPLKGTRIVPGLRADYTKQTAEWDVSPRVVVRQDLTEGRPRTTVKGGAGMYYQPPSPIDLDPVFGQPGLRSNRSVHYALGVEQQLGGHFEMSVEGFYKNLDRLVIQNNGNSGEGRVYGTEWLLRWRNDPKLFGWIAYTISRSERRDTIDEPLRLFQYDQTHILTVIASRDLGRGWRLGGRFRLVSGNLYTSNTYGALDLDRQSYLPVSAYPPFGDRLGAFHQLDVRVDKQWDLKVMKLTAYLDVQNIYFHRSPEGVSYNFNYTQNQPVLGLPILPILGIRGDL